MNKSLRARLRAGPCCRCVKLQYNVSGRKTSMENVANKGRGSLFSPFDMHGLQLKNRVVMSPLTRSRAGVERMPNRLMAEYYAQRASAGMIVTEATVVSKQAIGWLNS